MEKGEINDLDFMNQCNIALANDVTELPDNPSPIEKPLSQEEQFNQQRARYGF